MKKLIYLFSLAVFCLFNDNVFADGFNKIHTSDGSYVIAVGNEGRIFRSVNGGNTWAAYTEPLTNFKSVYTLGNDVWLTVDDGRVYKSSKTTTNLTSYNTGVTSSINSIHFINANTGFLCGDNGVLMTSVNGGVSWTSSNNGIPNVRLNAISFKDGSNGIVAGDDGKIYATSNGGSTWVAETVPTSRNLLDISYLADGIAAVGEWGTLLLKPNGNSWTSVSSKINTDIRGVSGSSINDIHVCGGGGFIRNNSGSPDFLNFEKNPMMANLVDIVYYNDYGFAVSSLNNAIIRTTNGGLTWQLPAGTTMSFTWQSKPGASGSSLGDNICPHPTDRNSIFTNFSGRTYVSRNRGETWSQVGTQIPSASTPHSFYVSPVDTNIWLCAIQASGSDKVVRTTDYGQTWNTSIARNFSNYGEPLQIDQNNPNIFYFAPDNGGFYRSTDNGATFTDISNNYPFRSPCDIMVTYDEPNTILLADGITGSGLADVFKSTNGGIDWSLKYSNPSSSEIPTMSNTTFNKEIAWLTNWPGGNIYKSTNTGETWDLNHTNSFSGWGSGICLEDPDLMITGSWSGGNTSISTNGGVNWTTITGLSGSGGVMTLVDRGYVIAQAGSSVYKLNVGYSVITNVIESNASILPASFELSQNYPNPFNPVTNLEFGISNLEFVSLKVYNAMGKEVATLVNEIKPAGRYQVTFNGSEFASGVYFYKIEAGRFSSVKRMILIK